VGDLQILKEADMAAKPVALLVGVTGMLGEKIARAVLDKGEMELRALVRAGSFDDGRKRAKLDALRARGATFVEGDLKDFGSLVSAARGAEVIISAVNNEPELIIEGQTRLLEAGERAGARKFIPSDFSVDYRKLDLGDNYNLDMRKKFLPAMEQSKLAYVSVLNGAFMEMPLSPFIGTINRKENTFNYWGEGGEPLDYTTTDDTARYVAAAAADEGLLNTFLEVAGETITFRRMKEVFEEATGRRLAENRRGSVEELREWIERKKETAQSPWEYLPQQYEWAMVSGKAKLDHIQNGRYPRIEPVKFREFFSRAVN
jgi:uncharacterized protein YbjT (DUF2867 family)